MLDFIGHLADFIIVGALLAGFWRNFREIRETSAESKNSTKH